MIKLVLFDLDDTLYPEQEFVYGGLQAAAHLAAEWFKIPADELFQEFWSEFEKGNTFIFNSVLNKLTDCSNEKIEQLINIYRKHKPTLKLFPDAEVTLKMLNRKSICVGVITDGYEQVQKSKVESLDLFNLVKFVIYTDSFGKDFWKPDARVFEFTLNKFRIKPIESVYIGDNPQKDFVAPRRLGMHSIQIKRNVGLYRDVSVADDYEPEFAVNSLEEIFDRLDI